MHAYELGRRAVAEKRNILDLATMHQDIMLGTIAVDVTIEQRDIYRRRSEMFLAEVMAPFEMMHRGFVDTIRQLQEVNATLEQRVEERTRALQDSQQRSADMARLYQILSSINSAIVRLRTREELFKEACRIVVNQGGYLVAGVTLRDFDDSTVPDSWCHFSHGKSSCNAVPREAVSAGVSVALEEVYHTGRAVVRHRDSQDSDSVNGIETGYATYALLPLVIDGTVIGVFALFSEASCSFTEDEMRLLLEMAGDLSFSLEHIQKEEQLNYLAYYDAMTGLPNRSLLLERLPVQLLAARRSEMMVALLLIDLMHFSDVNDTYGRHFGDSLLKKVSDRLCDSIGSCETVARLDSDRFAMSYSHITATHNVAHKLERDVLQAFSAPFRIGDTEIYLSVQVGIALFPTDADNSDALYKNAEIALKRAQSEGEPYLLYDPAMNERIIHSVTMETKLRRAIEQDQLVVHYQPKVATLDSRILGLEALLRLNDPDSGLVQPGDFIQLLEETGMIIDVGFWMMHRAAKDLQHWRKLGIEPPRVAVNVSPIQLEQKDFLDRLREIVGDSDGLDIEITESAVMKQVVQNIPKLEAVREMGFRIAIDDFGTGYSSLSYLSRLPVNALKIDRSFIVDMTEHANSLAIVTSIITLAHSLRLEVIAEGVELEEQAKLLKLLRCELIQGNFYSPPLPADQLVPLLRQGHP